MSQMQIVYTRDVKVPLSEDDPDMEAGWKCIPIPPTMTDDWVVVDSRSDRKTGWMRRNDMVLTQADFDLDTFSQAGKEVVVNHYLVTLNLTPQLHMHAYIMFDKDSKKEKYTKKVMDAMLDEAEKLQLKPLLPMFLLTKLSSGVGTVRDVVSKRYPEAKKMYETAKDFHITMWSMEAIDPDDECLMALH